MSLFKKQIKAITKSKCFLKILSALIYIYINIVYLTSKKYVIYPKSFDKTLYQKQNAIYAFWHNRLSLMFFMQPKKIKTNVLTSKHKDGQLVADTSLLFGTTVIEGSSSNISMNSLKKIIKSLVSGESLAITPDGPRGPVYQINSNIAKIAKRTSKTIIPMSFSCKKKKIMKSWDKFILPLPLNTIYLVYGTPIKPTEKNIDILLKKELNQLHKKFDKKFTEHADI